MRFAGILFVVCLALSACGDNLTYVPDGGTAGVSGKAGSGGSATGGSPSTGGVTGAAGDTGTAGAGGAGGTVDPTGTAGTGGSDPTGTAGAAGSASTGTGGSTGTGLSTGSSLPQCSHEVGERGGAVCQDTATLVPVRDADGLVYVQTFACTPDCQHDVSSTFNSGGVFGPVQHLTNSCPDANQNNHPNTCGSCD